MSNLKLPQEIFLGVNIDHVATLRQARLTRYPDPVEAVYAAENGGADGITIHLREDKRHIQPRDVELIKAVLLTRLNLEMAVTADMIAFAEQLRPPHCCLVPEKRAELTTEGGLDVAAQLPKMREACQRLKDAGIQVSLFIDPEPRQIEAAILCAVPAVELHTGCFAEATTAVAREAELKRLQEAATLGHREGLIINAGHGLNYQNVKPIAAIPEMNELNIGHGIIARAMFSGLEAAVREMKKLMREARS